MQVEKQSDGLLEWPVNVRACHICATHEHACLHPNITTPLQAAREWGENHSKPIGSAIKSSQLRNSLVSHRQNMCWPKGFIRDLLVCIKLYY